MGTLESSILCFAVQLASLVGSGGQVLLIQVKMKKMHFCQFPRHEAAQPGLRYSRYERRAVAQACCIAREEIQRPACPEPFVLLLESS